MAKQLTDSNLEEVLASGRPVVIDFWAEWCGPCRSISPIVDELATEYEGVVDIYTCDVDENSDVCGSFGSATCRKNRCIEIIVYINR